LSRNKCAFGNQQGVKVRNRSPSSPCGAGAELVYEVSRGRWTRDFVNFTLIKDGAIETEIAGLHPFPKEGPPTI
jgi:hypothetical protein